MRVSSASIYDQLPTQLRRERSGQNAVERLAVAVVRQEIAAMPASVVVQLALWPDEVAGWAREVGVAESLVYNMLAARKPYTRTRQRLAERLEVSPAVLDHLIEARRAVPSARRGPEPLDDDGTLASAAPPEPIDGTRPPYPRHRDGTNAIERRAVRIVELDVASMPAASVVGLALWPETLAAWSRAERLKSSVVWATLSGTPSAPVRDALARRLGVSLRELDALVQQERAVSIARRPPAARVARATPATPDRAEAAPPAARPDDAPASGGRRAQPGGGEQLGLGL